MAVRVTDAEVREIIEIDASLNIDAFITAANLLVTQVCTDSSLSVALLKEIERWVAAHFVAIREPKALSRKAGPFSETSMSKVGLGLKVTHWGQQAMILDTSGALAAASESRIAADIEWVGPAYE